MTKPYINVYALLDDDDEVIEIQKTEFTKEKVEALKKEHDKHLRLGVLVTDPTLIDILPLRPEVRGTTDDIQAWKLNLLGKFLTINTNITRAVTTSVTFLIVTAYLYGDKARLWGYTCKGSQPFQQYSALLKQEDLLILLTEGKITILEEIPFHKMKAKTTYILSEK